MNRRADPIMSRFRADLDATYGARIERVVLFGSRARGDSQDHSDYDVAVFLAGAYNFDAESRRLAEIETQILFETGAVIHSLPFEAGAYCRRTGLMHEIRREGVDL